MRRVSILLAATVLAIGGARAETIRCGSHLVDESASVDELLQKCGEPARKERKVEDVWARNATGGTRVVGQTVTERWTYERGSQAAPVVVTIVDGKVKSVERER
jgi:hypothetical protein